MLEGDGLKPCPFCGGWAHPLHHGGHKDYEHFLVMCSDCFAQTVGKTLEEARDAWNLRADPPK